MASMKSFGFVAVFVVITDGLNFFEPSAAEGIDWRDCGIGLNKKCGQIISSKVNLNEGPYPDEECCKQLMKIGKPCHDAYTQAHIEIEDFEGFKDNETMRSNDVWDNCVRITELIPELRPVEASGNPAPAEAPRSDSRDSGEWSWFWF